MSQRRAPGMGTKPRKHKGGGYHATMRVTYPDGTRKRESFYGATPAEVERKRRARAREVDTGTAVRPNRATVGDFLDRWLADVVKPSRRPKTYRSYESIVRNHLVPSLGRVELARLTPAMIQRAVAGDPTDPAGARTRELAYVVLRAALGVAVKWNELGTNPADRAEKPRNPKREMLFYTPDEVELLLAARGDDRLSALYRLAIGSGMRESELLGLRWQDVRLVDGEVDVRYQLDDENLTLVEPKTKESIRSVDLSESQVAELRAHRTRMFAEGHTGSFVFCDTRGGPLRISNVRLRSWKPLIKRAGVRDIRFHDLRHTAAALQIAAGVNPLVISRRLGHADVATTLRIYGHLLKGVSSGVASSVEAFMAKAKSEKLGSVSEGH